MVKVAADSVIVPDLYSLSRAAAIYDIEQAKLTVGWIRTESRDLAPGLVTRQDPVAGTKVAIGDTVHFWLSRAEPKFIYVDPPRITIEHGDTITFTAILVYDDGAEDTVTRIATWGPERGNRFIGRKAGKYIISAEYEGASGSATVTVNEPEEPSWEPPISSADDFLGEPDARLWVDTNCPAWRCTKDGTCA